MGFGARLCWEGHSESPRGTGTSCHMGHPLLLRSRLLNTVQKRDFADAARFCRMLTMKENSEDSTTGHNAMREGKITQVPRMKRWALSDYEHCGMRSQRFDGWSHETASPFLRSIEKSQKTTGNYQARKSEHHNAAAQIQHAAVSRMLGEVLVSPSPKGHGRAGKASGRMKDLERQGDRMSQICLVVRDLSCYKQSEATPASAGGRLRLDKRKVLLSLSGYVPPARSLGTRCWGCDKSL